MFIKLLLVVFLAIFAVALPQDTAGGAATGGTAAPPTQSTAAPPKVDWITNFHHQPIEGVKEGDKLVITYDAVTDPTVLENAKGIKSWTIGIGRGTGNQVRQQLFMESERIIGVPTVGSSYTFQLPAQMENDQYCIQYTPYGSETGTDRAVNADGVQLEALYEIWFPITGSLKIGEGPLTAQNTAVQDQPTAQQSPAPVVGNNSTNLFGEQDGESGSNILTPTITAFIAVIFACLFI